ncbi:uncharacterized protein KIAA2026 [Betta splendens]|uniref:Uncharacterized protein KIAA2026 n=1 Tax=Betta splendens TaxID=158456 RepID=A0A6P7P5C1_BETSP|nr:uncharacterized protein KIAA2026 [Betta splendens]XP_029025418.1 uncharacterized protein KIAA2026 [Betta splendens]
MTDQVAAARSLLLFHNQDLTVTDPATQQPSSEIMSSQSKLVGSTDEDGDRFTSEDRLSNGIYEDKTVEAPGDDSNKEEPPAQSNDGMSEFSNSDLSLPEVCISTNTSSFEEDMNYEVQQAYRIFTGFLLDKHKGITSPFLHPTGHQETQRGIGGVLGWGQAQLRQSMCLRRMEKKFINQEYESITGFVADFRLMLENCYRYHGVDHWISKQAQKLEIMLEQKLTLLSRPLREKTTLAVTSKGRFGAEEERASSGTSTRRRLAPRSLATITVGGHESIMVQTLRLEEQQKAREEKRQRELEKKEAEEVSAKQVEEWEQNLLSQASPQTVDTLWELPAIGHFLCLAQTALNLPEIVFFELERCLLMPRCSLLLSKIMSSLLSPPQRRAALHRRPALPYRRWESELRQRVLVWYCAVGASQDHPGRAEQLGLCHQFFRTLGEVSPLEEKPFHLLPFYQRVWLLKGLCDHVYETQKDVQDAVLAQPIHECRESILGYDSKENAYIHFPHFCGADLRIYCQSPSPPPAFPFPSVWVRRVEIEPGSQVKESDGKKSEENNSHIGYDGGSMDAEELHDFNKGKTDLVGGLKRENEDGEEENERLELWSLKKRERSESGSSDGHFHFDSKWDVKIHTNSLSLSHSSPIGGSGVKRNVKEEPVELEHYSKRLKQEHCILSQSKRIIEAETQEPCLSVGEHSYTGRSPARSVTLASPTKSAQLKMEEESCRQGHQSSLCLECCKNKMSDAASEEPRCSCSTLTLARLSSESTRNSSEERVSDKIWSKKKKRKKKRGREKLPRPKGETKQLQHGNRRRLGPAEAPKSAATSIKRKDKKKKHKAGKKLEPSKKIKDEPSVYPSFKLVCKSLEELRELIGKTEDELDDLESTKKRLGRWYYRREAVKDLHSTLIRLLNELLPWEPKLVKAYQRNRLRLKKEFDDFKKHPEYSNFVREECVSSTSSDDDDDDEEKVLGKEICPSSDQYRRSEEEDLEHMVPRGLWSGANSREFVTEGTGEHVTRAPPNHLKHPLATVEKATLLPSVQFGFSLTSTSDSGPHSGSEINPSTQFRDSNITSAARMPLSSLSSRPTILHPTTGLPKGYTPIPTLLAKSVGNKVTLMKRPADCPGVSNADVQRKRSLVSMPAKDPAAQSPQSSSQKSPHMQAQGLQQMHVVGHSGMATVMTPLPKPPQTKPGQTVQKGPAQMVKDSSGQVRISVHPVMDQSTAEKIMQQVVILPSNLLIHTAEEKAASLHPQPPKSVQVPASKVSSPVNLSTNVPGFTIPENRIPVQQVAPLKDARTGADSSASAFCQQQAALNPERHGAAQSCTPPVSTQSAMPKPFPIASHHSASPGSVSAEPVQPKDPKQELKTVCIRDSQSILVTTRGGNTGIVKVQTSSDHSVLGSLPTSPVITISPQFKAFLLSKTLPNLSPAVLTQTCTNPTSISLAEPQKQVSSVIKSPSAATTSIFTAVTGSLPVTRQGQNGSMSQITAAAVSPVKNAVVVPSLSVPQSLSPTEAAGKTGVTWAITDERAPANKFILVTPSSCSTSNVAMSKGTNSHAGSRLMFISQAAAPSATAFAGTIPKQAVAPGASGPLLSASSSSRSLKTELRPGGNSESVSNIKMISLPSGLQTLVSGRTTEEKNTGAPASPSKHTPASVSNSGYTPVTTTTITCSNPAQPVSHSVTASFQLQGVPSFTMMSHTGPSTCTSTPGSVPAGNLIRKDLGLAASVAPGAYPARVATTMQGTPTHNSTPALQSSEEASSSQHLKKNQRSTFTATSTSAAITTSVNSTVQQRVVINTTTPLAAGTQILLSNARFVVPPQGLGPGTHVLIISSPSPQQVPTVSAANTGAFLPLPGAGNAAVSSQSPARLPSGIASNSPIATCTAAVGSPLLATPPSVMSVQLTGTSGPASTLLPSKTNVVSALPKLPAAQVDHFASGGLKLASSPPRLGSVPALVSPVTTRPRALNSAALPVRLAARSAMRAEYLSPVLRGVAHPSPRLSGPLSSAPLSLNPPAGAPPSPSSPSPAAGAPLHSPLTAHQVVAVTTPGPSTYAQRMAAPTTSLSQAFLHTGRGSTSAKTQIPVVMQPVLGATRTQILPTVAVPPILSPASKVQTLPVATVPPIGSTVSTFETLPVETMSSSSSTVTITPAQPLTSLKIHNTIHPPDTLTNQAGGKHSTLTSALGIHANVASKLLISPDGAVVSTVQCQVKPAELTACSKPLLALMVPPSSSTRALHTHDSSLEPSQADAK